MLIKISKFFYFLIVMYYAWFQVAFFQIPNMLLILGTGMIGFILLHAMRTKEKILQYVTTELLIWILFAFFSFATGAVISTNINLFFKSITTFIEFLLLIYGMIYISNQDNSIDFIINVLIVLAVTCSITTIFRGIEYGAGRISMSASNNPNALGITMAIGICCILYKVDFRKLYNSIFGISLVLLLTYVTILTGSRKSLLSVLLILVFWIIFVLFPDMKDVKLAVKLRVIISLLLVIIVSYLLIYPFFKESVLFSRMSDLFQSGSDEREGMYSEALRLFKTSPIVGVGFNNYRVLSVYGTYSHSTYAEALACVGIVGSLLYFIPYAIIARNFLKIIKAKYNGADFSKAKIMISLFATLLFLGIGIIHFYEMTSIISFGILFAFFSVYTKKMKN